MLACEFVGLDGGSRDSEATLGTCIHDSPCSVEFGGLVFRRTCTSLALKLDVHPGLATMPGNGGVNENSHLAPDGVGPDYGKDVRNAFMAGDQQASRCVNVMSPVRRGPVEKFGKNRKTL